MRAMILSAAAGRVPPQAWFAVSALFHYLGPAFAVLLFPAAGVLGVAWFRIASAALILGAWTRPWRALAVARGRAGWLLLGLGGCLAVMNTAFYLALERLPMSLVAAMEFVGPVALALAGVRSPRNLAALVLAVAGVLALVDVKWVTDPEGLAWSLLNAVLFAGYIVLGHRAAATGAGGGVERLGAAMTVAFVVVMPIGFAEARSAFASPGLVLAGIGVGLCSSVIPYVCDQIAMSRLPRASFSLMLSLLPAVATLIAAVVLAQIPSPRDLLGVALVMLGVAAHRPAGAVGSDVEREDEADGEARAEGERDGRALPVAPGEELDREQA